MALWTGRREGDLGPGCASPGAGTEDLELRRRRVLDRPWSYLRQAHGSRVVTVEAPGEGVGEVGDALVSSDRTSCLAVFTADCAPIALGSSEGVIGAVHAGWRGLLAGVVEAGADAMRELGATDIVARVGPCIHGECYEFSPADVTRLERRLGRPLRSSSSRGAAALDMVAAVRAALRLAGVDVLDVDPACTSCSPQHFSYRGAGDSARQALVVWRE